MGFIVKNTTDFSLFDIVCPHYCRGCGRLGRLLCERCKKYMELAPGREADAIFRAGRRRGLLMEMTKEYKYGPVRGMGEVLAGILAEAIPGLSGDVAVVPLPTVGKHIRARGFDHMELIARKLAKKRGWERVKMLRRMNSAVQVGSDAETREKQAQTAYALAREVEAERTYLLVDDVCTTGASMKAAMKVLREAGAKKVYGAVLMRGK